MRKCQLAIAVLVSFGLGAFGCSSESYNEVASNIDFVTQAPTDQPTDQPTQTPTEQPTQTPTDQPTDEPSDKKPCDSGPIDHDNDSETPDRLPDECVACLAKVTRNKDESEEDWLKRVKEECGGADEGTWDCISAQAKVRSLGIAIAGVVFTCTTAAAPACAFAILGAGAAIISGLEAYLDEFKKMFDNCALGFCFDMCPQALIWNGACAALKANNNLSDDEKRLRDKVCGASDAAKDRGCPGF